MMVTHVSEYLQQMESDPGFKCDLNPGVIAAFRTRMAVVRASPTEAPLLSLRMLRIEILDGKTGLYKMRLNNEYFLSLRFVGSATERVAEVNEIAPYQNHNKGAVES
jgi:plasmid maintenance system killer protein